MPINYLLLDMGKNNCRCVFPFIPRFISYVNWTGLAHQILQKSLCVYICQICVIYYLWILHQVIYLPGKEYFWKRWPYYVRCPQALLLRGSDQRIIQCWHAFKKILLLKLCVCMHITNFFFFQFLFLPTDNMKKFHCQAPQAKAAYMLTLDGYHLTETFLCWHP